MTLSEAFAHFIQHPVPLGEEEVYLCTRSILDTVGAMVLGSRTGVVEKAARVIPRAGKATLAGIGGGFSARDAAFLNGISGHELELDDTSSSNLGHPTVAVLPALLALGEELNSPGEELIRAFAVATEVECKLGRLCAHALHERGWHASSVTGIVGAAAGAAYLLKLKEKELVNCLGIAASMAAGVRENFGTDTKSLHIGKAAADGLLAACLAREGCTASSSALDGREGYLYEYSGLRFDPFGSDWYKTLGNRYDVCTPGFAIKQYPSCNPYLPTQPKEIAEAALRCYEAGAAMVHIHVRDDNDAGSMRFDKFEEAVGLIRASGCPVLLNLTSSGGQGFSWEERIRPFRELRPEMASFDAGTMNWLHSVVFMNEPKFLELCGQEMRAAGVKPEIEVFDMGMLNTAKHYLKTGVLDAPAHFQLCLGAPGGMEATTESLVYLVNHLPENCTWSTFGIGRGANEITLAALAMGGNIRVGLEDNVYYNKGILAQGSQQFIGRVKRVAAEFGRVLATPEEARAILGLK